MVSGFDKPAGRPHNPIMLSFVVPAHNEEPFLPQTLTAIRSAADALELVYEVIVVNDASTDRTAEIAREHGAVVESVALRKISAVRNAGARRARGDILVFVDADTILPEKTLAAALRALAHGAAGGGAVVWFDRSPAWWTVVVMRVWNSISRIGRMAAGCFIFVRRDIFETAGGFNEAYYAGEELVLSKSIRSRGPFIILTERVITSSRKAQSHTLWEMLCTFTSLGLGGSRRWQMREGMDLWYERRHPKPPA